MNRRIIPADAGSTIIPTLKNRKSGDHPRGCGEHRHFRWPYYTPKGSSPRMRGALSLELHEFIGDRIIPADAGSTESPPMVPDSLGDHPRGCGEHIFAIRPGLMIEGSSPRMRGAQRLANIDRALDGIIPADAGSTCSCRQTAWSGWDHPRGCGEHCRNKRQSSGYRGSSPRMRGAQAVYTNPNIPEGIIPADAGSTQIPFDWQKSHKDHPRGCGEHPMAATAYQTQEGSSPRMRGARCFLKTFTLIFRIIPADAGSTGPCHLRKHRRMDHPRGCGEHANRINWTTFEQGSSPRMRGAPAQHLFFLSI